jgi:thioredoxin-related protein
MRRIARTAFAFVALLICSATFAEAAQLVMVDVQSCPYCAKFRREVAPTYNSSAAGKLAPLRLVSPLKHWPNDLAQIAPVPYTPVFILVENGHEVGRFAGYSNRDTFWAKLNPLLARL